jgi:hypothetical protein
MRLRRILRDIHRGLHAARTVNRIRLRVPREGDCNYGGADYDLRIATISDESRDFTIDVSPNQRVPGGARRPEARWRAR